MIDGKRVFRVDPGSGWIQDPAQQECPPARAVTGTGAMNGGRGLVS